MRPTEMPPVVYRRDYQPPEFWIDRIELEFDLDPEQTIVTARLDVRRNDARDAGLPLILDGEHLELQGVWLDGRQLEADQYTVTGDQLTIPAVPDRCQIETRVAIAPTRNTALSGLYQSAGMFCTQCEAMGFRRITYFPDRPDVLTRYRVTIRADQTRCPVMLSNGNRMASRPLDGGRHEVVWEDPFPKPSYLFALVAGELRCHRGTFVTRSGRSVQLEIWVEPQNIDRCDHALRSLEKAMRWDEETFGREYDLDVYMIVAVNDFNMGAMENKGLNIFNSKYVLASPATATDDDYEGVEAVIAHEYFHNWTGNRVTCRDWFQLTLKEGLTVFRDQQFTADQTSAAVKRISDVNLLRSRQFPEDAGPMAHPIRPESYISMDNFYTSTVYIKGAEIIRIYHTLLGADGFRRGMDLYFQRHDGQAVTCDDFRAALADANGADFRLLDRWYSQPGTPEVDVADDWQPETGRYSLALKQSYPPLPDGIPGVAGRKPVPIPVAVGLLGPDGKDLPLQLEGEASPAAGSTRVLLLDCEKARFTFTGIFQRPVASVLRNFSAPVRLRAEQSREDLAFLMAHDSDPFNRWDAGQTLAKEVLIELAGHVRDGRTLQLPELLSDAFGRLLADDAVDGSFKALALILPNEIVLGQEMDVVDPDALHEAREFVRAGLAQAHRTALLDEYHASSAGTAYGKDQEAIHRRRLKNTALAYLSTLAQPETTALVMSQFETADNMTDSQAALTLLADLECPERAAALAAFYERWRTDPLVLDKWFTVQASSRRADTVQRVIELQRHPDFRLSNPNRVRALIGAFAMQNQVRFHGRDGAGYALLADAVLQIDAANPQLASRLVSALNIWRRFDHQRQSLMQAQLHRIAAQDGLSKDVFEIVQRAMKFA